MFPLPPQPPTPAPTWTVALVNRQVCWRSSFPWECACVCVINVYSLCPVAGCQNTPSGYTAVSPQVTGVSTRHVTASTALCVFPSSKTALFSVWWRPTVALIWVCVCVCRRERICVWCFSSDRLDYYLTLFADCHHVVTDFYQCSLLWRNIC